MIVLAAACLWAPTAASGAPAKKDSKPCRSTKHDPVYRTPGYKGVCDTPKTGPQQPLPPVVLGANGRDPEVLVDAAGTAHIVWNEDGGDSGPDQLHYCRLKRGANSCDNPTTVLPVDQPAEAGQPSENNASQFNEDIAGPRILAVGDGLVFITHRYPNQVRMPDDSFSDRTTYMWTSDDGGNTITGPAIVGDAEPSGGAVVFGPPEGPRIGLISETRTGGTFFQSISPGTFTRAQANLGGGGPDRSYSGSLVSVGGLPMTAFSDLGGSTFIRQWSGSGDPSDPGSWSETQTSGIEPHLAAGPGGAFLVTAPQQRTSLQVRRLNGTQPGRATTIKTGAYGARDLFEDPGGALRLAWVDREGTAAEVLERSSSTGRSFEAERVVARAKQGIDELDLGATTDGGGFGVYTAGGSSQGFGQILAAPFGTQAPTGLRGIGNLLGGGRDPDVTTSCQEVSYRAVQILTDRGCFQPVIGKPGLKVTEGAFRLNGLWIVPDAGVRIQMSTKQGDKTIDSLEGSVTVQLRPGGSAPIDLWHGELHLELPTGAAGTKLFSVDLEQFAPKIKGFPVSGDFDVILREHAVEIPITLTLPKVFGGLTGAATLRADNEHGLSVDSVSFLVPKFVLGPLELSDIEVSWNGSSDTWTGGAGIKLLGAGMRVRVTFMSGRFTDGLVELSLGWPGVSLAPDVFLNRVSGELHLGDTTWIEAGALFGAQQLPPDSYVYTVNGKLRATITPKFAMDYDGVGTLGGVPVSHAHAHGDVDGHFWVTGALTWDLDLIKGNMSVKAFVDAAKGDFGGKLKGDLTLDPGPYAPDISIGVEALFSKQMIAGCESPLGGFAYYFSDRRLEIYAGECPDEPPTPVWVPEPTVNNGPRARAAQGATPNFTLPSGLAGASIQVDGIAGPPAVTLIAPSGARVEPVATDAPGAGSAAAVVTRTPTTTAIGLRKPEGGNWTVEEAQPGSVTEVRVGRVLPQPKVSAKVSGRGRNRVLTYKATARKGLVVRFFERIGAGGREIGVAKGKAGRLRFSADDGPGGKRTIEARVEQGGKPLLQKAVASYRAPGPIQPARVRGLRLRRSGSALVVRWGRAAGAQQYVVRLTVSDGRGLLRLVKGRSLRLGGVARNETVLVTVTARNSKGRQGKPAKGRLAKAGGKRR